MNLIWFALELSASLQSHALEPDDVKTRHDDATHAHMTHDRDIQLSLCKGLYTPDPTRHGTTQLKSRDRNYLLLCDTTRLKVLRHDKSS